MSSSNIITAAPTEGQDKSQSSHFNANATFNYTQQTLLLCTPKSITLKPRTQMCSNLSVSHMNPSTWQAWHIRSLIQQHGRCTGAVTVLLFKFSFMFSRYLFCFPAVSCSPHSLVFPPHLTCISIICPALLFQHISVFPLITLTCVSLPHSSCTSFS